MSQENDTPRAAYFGSWSSYGVPRVPREPISREEAEGRTTYYVGHFDREDRLVRFAKFHQGALEWQDEYEYWDNGKVRARRMSRAGGPASVQRFDRKGRILPEEGSS
jgi:hypothetical protein